MVCILRSNYKKLFLILIIATLASILFVFSISASVRLLSSKPEPNEITDGVYNIVNKKTGQYVDVFDIAYDPQGKAYLSNKTGQSGQNFLITRQDDGTYYMSPQSEGEAYSLSYEFDIMESEYVSKKNTISGFSKFNIVSVDSGNPECKFFNIKPAGMSDNKLTLDISSGKGQFGYSLVGLALENDSDSQCWEFVKVSSETLSIHGGYVNVRQGGTHNIYAQITPKNLIGNMVWESSDPEIASVDDKGIVYGVSEGTATITVTCGNKTASTTVKVTDLVAFTWYSQHNALTGGWYAENMKDVIFNYGGERKALFVHGYETAPDWMDMGCKLCCEAMVLHNMGATLTNGYDFRTNETDDLIADPYTVALANTGASGVNVSGSYAINNPIMVNNTLISPRFTVEGKAVSTQTFHGANLRHIKELLETHPEGVIVGLINVPKDTTHFVVFTECLNPDDPYGNYEFRVCDSAASIPTLGDNVPFKESISYRSLGYGYGSIFIYSVYNVAEE